LGLYGGSFMNPAMALLARHVFDPRLHRRPLRELTGRIVAASEST